MIMSGLTNDSTRRHVRVEASKNVCFDYYIPINMSDDGLQYCLSTMLFDEDVIWIGGQVAETAIRNAGIKLPGTHDRTPTIAYPTINGAYEEIILNPSLPMVIFSYPKRMSALEAMQIYEQKERNIELIVSFLVAATCISTQKILRPLSYVNLYFIPIIKAMDRWWPPGDSKHLDASTMRSIAEDYARSLFEKSLRDIPSDKIREIMETPFVKGKIRTIPDRRNYAITISNVVLKLHLDHLGTAAFGNYASTVHPSIPFRGKMLNVDDLTTLMWTQYLELEQLSPSGIHIFTRGKEFPGQVSTIEQAAATEAGDPFSIDEVPTMPWDEAKPWADALLDDALENAAYTPSGLYRVILPENSLLRPWGVSIIKLWVEDGVKHIWVGIVSGNKDGAVFRWRPECEYPFTPFVVPAYIAGFVHLHIAALWRDLRVVGNEVLVEPGAFKKQKKSGQTKKIATTTAEQEST